MRFIQWLLDWLTRAPEAVVTSLNLAEKLRRRSKGDDPAPGTKEQRAHAYQRFADASLDAVLNVQLIATLGTPVVGLLWTLPAAFRAHRRYIDSSYESIAALHEIGLLGDRDVLEAAFVVAHGMGALGSSYRPSGWRKKVPDEFTRSATDVSAAIAAFSEVARRDLQKPE